MRSLGATDCIPKPFEWEDLIGKIEERPVTSTAIAFGDMDTLLVGVMQVMELLGRTA